METTNYQPSTINQQSSDEISLKEIIQKLGDWYRYLKTQWWKIAIAGMIGGAIGFVYAWMQPVSYTAKTTFVVEDLKSGMGNLGSLASLAGQFGVDVGGGGGGLIAGDNVLLYFKSESLARQVLLSPIGPNSNYSLANRYIISHGLRKAWEKNKRVGKIDFQIDKGNTKYTRLQDSLLNFIINENILKKQFEIVKVDKKAGFIQVSVTMKDEILAKCYCDKLIDLAIRKYVNLKTERQKKTVDNLQSRADSIAFLLSKKTLSAAALQTTSITSDINPLYKTQMAVATELTVRDKTMLLAVYGEVIKNLELAKFTLSQETPVIQVVDSSYFPLKKNKSSRMKYAFFSSVLSLLILTITLLFNKKNKS